MDRLMGPSKVSRGSVLRWALLAAVLLSLVHAAGALAAETRIDSGPDDGGFTSNPTPTFTFSSPDDPDATFQCAVDPPPPPLDFGPCTPGSGTPGSGIHTVSPPLSDGTHIFQVRALGSLIPLPDLSPEIRMFTVDTIHPDTTIDSGPTGPISDDTPTFDFSSNEAGTTFECSIDSPTDFGPCSGPGSHTTDSLPDAQYTFRVRATDRAGNADTDPAARTFTVDTDPPNTTIDSGPANNVPTSDPTPTFTFASSEPNSEFACRVDDDPFASCSGPGRSHTTGTLSNGGHVFRVRATDEAGNPDPEPAQRVFIVDTSAPPDTTAPDTTITKRPKGKIKTRKRKARVKVSFTSEPGATYRCRFDKTRYKPCDSPYDVAAKAKPGKGKKHTISVRAIDGAGNVGKPAVVEFRVLRSVHLRASVAQRTVITALRRHGFAKRVVKSSRVDCHRRSHDAFRCRFSSRFPGYLLRGKGEVELRAHLSYRFRVKAQGVRLTLTDENEKQRLR
jgi:hypothetical protein